MPRGAVCSHSGSPAATAASVRARMACHCAPPGSRCIQVIDSGRPASRASSSTRSNSASKRSGPCSRSKSLTICSTPRSRPRNTCARPASSAAVASAAGVASPAVVRWLSVRPVEKPAAPASSASASRRCIAAMSSAVAASWARARSPITAMRSGSCGTCTRKSRVCGRRPSASRYSGKERQSKRTPSASATPGMSSTPSIKDIRPSTARRLSPGASGAKPTPQLPNSTVVTPWCTLGLKVSSQLACPS